MAQSLFKLITVQLLASARSSACSAPAVYKDAEGDVTVEHLSNLSEDEAIELGSKVAALVGLGIEGEEGMETGAEVGAAAVAENGGGVEVFSDEQAWD